MFRQKVAPDRAQHIQQPQQQAPLQAQPQAPAASAMTDSGFAPWSATTAGTARREADTAGLLTPNSRSHRMRQLQPVPLRTLRSRAESQGPGNRPIFVRRHPSRLRLALHRRHVSLLPVAPRY